MPEKPIHLIIESSSVEGIQFILQSLEGDFAHVSATMPVATLDGRFLSSAYVSNDRTIMEVR